MSDEIIITKEIEGFKVWQKNKNLSNNTISIYENQLRKIFKNKRKLNKDDLLLAKSKAIEQCSPKTVNIMVNAINSYIEYYCEKEDNPIYLKLKLKCIKVQQKNYLENVISYQQYLQFIKYLKKNSDNPSCEKLYYIVITLGMTGMRVSELVKCNAQAVKMGYFDILGKGGKTRRIYLSKKLQKELEVYIEKYKLDGFLFLNNNNTKISTRGLAHLLKDYAKKCDIDEKVIYPHSFRHMFAKQFLSKRQDIALLSDLLGHNSIETTRIYLRLTSEEQKQIVDEVVTW